MTKNLSKNLARSRGILAFSAVLLMPGFTPADYATDYEKYMTLEKVSIQSEPMVEDLQMMGVAPDSNCSSHTPQINPNSLEAITIGEIINLGKAIWEIIVANKPVVNVATDTASALPAGIKCWDALSNWQNPVSKSYHVTYKNLLRLTVVDFRFRVSFTPGGQYKRVGRYLTHVTVIPAVDVLPGFTFNAQASVPSVINVGTDKNPIGGAQVQVKWSVDTVVKHSDDALGFFVRGDGQLIEMQ